MGQVSRQYKAVYVKWLDHAKTDGDPKGMKPMVRHTLGWVVKETDSYLVLAMDTSPKAREYGFCIVKSLITHRASLDGAKGGFGLHL